MAIAIVALLAFGGSYAYFTASSGMTGGKVVTGTLTMGEAVTLNTTLDDSFVPGQSVAVTGYQDIAVSGNTYAAYRLKISNIAITAKTAGATAPDAESSLFTIEVSGLDETTPEWVEHDGYWYYYQVKTGDTVTKLGNIIPSITISLASTATNEYQNLEVTFGVTFEATQAEYAGDNTNGYTQATAIDPADAAALWTA